MRSTSNSHGKCVQPLWGWLDQFPARQVYSFSGVEAGVDGPPVLLDFAIGAGRDRATARACRSRGSRRSLSQLRDHAEPQGNEIRRRGPVRRFLAHGGVHHHELGGRIYQDHLAPDSDQGKTPLLAGQDPYLVSIAEVWGGGSRCEIGVARIRRP